MRTKGTKEEQLKELEETTKQVIERLYEVTDIDRFDRILSAAEDKLEQRAGRFVANVIQTGGTDDEIIRAVRQAAATLIAHEVRVAQVLGRVVREAILAQPEPTEPPPAG